MKNVAVLHDALRGETFGFVVKSAGSFEFHGVDASSSQWASWINTTSVKTLHAVDLPPGVIVGAFKQVSDDEFEKIVGNSDSISIKVASRKDVQYVATIREKSKSKTPGVFDTPINHFKNNQFINVVNYKGLAFRIDAKKSSLLRESKSNGYSFNLDTGKFEVRPTVEQKSLIRERIESNTTASFERRTGIKSLKILEQDGSRNMVGHANSLETKSIGGTIGGGVARRGRRAARGLVARFDPKAWDGDGDGLVQEGTAFQRPAIPGVNDRASRGRVDTAAVERVMTSGRTSPKESSETTTTRAREAARSAVRRAASTTPARARREQAVVQGGMRSRVKKKTRAVPGLDKVNEIDGTAWAAMSDEQKTLVKANLDVRRKKIQDAFKKDTDFWDAYLRNPKNRKRHPGIDGDSDFTSDFMVNLQAEIQEAERNAMAAIAMDDPDREKEIEKIDKRFQNYYRLFDDLKTIRTMQSNDKFEMLEHLHPASREAALGKNTKDANVKKVDGTFPSLKRTNESTYFGRSGREKKYVDEKLLETGQKAKIKKGTDKKLAGLSRRILDPNPKRVAKKARRQARRTGQARAAGEAEAVKPGIARRIRRARRTISSKLRGQETAGDILKRSNKGRTGVHPLEIKDGKSVDDVKLKVTDKWINALAFVADEVDRIKKGEKGKNDRSEKVGDVALLNVWENMGHNALPTLITEDQWEMLVGQGWKPMSRGVGNDTGFVDAYLEDDDRFIPGMGGRAYGVGEYWAPDGSGHSWSYGNANMLGFVSPDARMIKDGDLKKVTDDGRKIKDGIRAFDSGMPGDEAFNMEPKDYVDALLAQLDGSIPKDSPLWNTQIGQIYAQLLESYSKVGNDSDKKREIWAAMQYLHKMFSHDYKYFAPVLGYDAVDAGSGVTLVHNRAAVVVVDKAFTINEGKQAFQSAKAAA